MGLAGGSSPGDRDHSESSLRRGGALPFVAALATTLLAATLLAETLLAPGVSAQAPAGKDVDGAGALEPAPEGPPPPGKVEVTPAARDEEIEARLTEILQATEWFEAPVVDVDKGVVFLGGRTANDEYKEWAGELARSTEGAVAAVNRIEVAAPEVWDFGPAMEELRALGRALVRALPFVVLAGVVFLLAWGASRLAASVVRGALRQRVASALLREVAARGGAILIFLLGLYLVLRVSGLSRLAVTVIGGTGLVGLILGIAFRDISENFLASLFLSFQQPFREGDLVEIAGATGYVQRLTSRTTILMTLDGNHVQVPNSTVFKSTIRNYTSNPKRREDFTVGIGYDDSISKAQQVALDVLNEHPAILSDPEPSVLVESLGAATVNLHVYFWLDGSQHSWIKVRSSVIRMVKRAFQDAGISLPDEAREVLFPRAVPVRMLGEEELHGGREPARERPAAAEVDAEAEAAVTEAEGGLHTEAGELEAQARQAWTPEGEENLLSRAAPRAGRSEPP